MNSNFPGGQRGRALQIRGRAEATASIIAKTGESYGEGENLMWNMRL